MANVDLDPDERDLINELLIEHRKGIQRGDISYGSVSDNAEYVEMCNSIIKKMTTLSLSRT